MEVEVNNKKHQVFHGLEELCQLELAPPLKLELPQVDFGNFEELETQAKRVSEDARQIRTWIRSTLGQLDLAKNASREARELVAEKIERVKEEVKKNLPNFVNHEIPAYRRAAWLGLLEYEFSKNLRSRQEVVNLLERLVREDRLVENPDGTLMAYNRTYDVHPASLFEEPEIAEVGRFFICLLRRVFQEIGKGWERKSQKLRAQGSANLKDFLSGKPGKYIVEIPPEETIKNGEKFWRGGGVLFVQSNGKNISPLDASGSIEDIIREIMRLSVYLSFHTLTLDKPPFVLGNPERGRKVQLFWHLLKRGIRPKKESEQLINLKEDYVKQETVTVQSFFLEHQFGICLAEFQGTWQKTDGGAGPSNFFFLVERKEEKGTKRIRIVNVPDPLGDFFAQCMDEYIEKGSKFEGLPYPLNAVLQAIYGQALEASQDAKKAGQIAKRQ